MIYTVGHAAHYRQVIEEQGPEALIKLGRQGEPSDADFYPGGIAFRTAEGAVAWNTLDGSPDWIVWGLDCDWTNTYLYDDGTHRIIVDAPIVDLEAIS